MAIKTFKPYTPARRNMTVSGFEGVDKKARPERSLVETLKKHAGRNSYGHITVRHHGGGNKRKYRIIDFKRQKTDMFATVERIEYDPNRTANIALISYVDGEKAYIVAPNGLKVGDVVMNGPKAELKPGNSMKIKDIPVGVDICCIELTPGRGAAIARSAGQVAILRGKEEEYAQIKLPSGEVRMIHLDCRAMIGQIGNADLMNTKLGKAGKKRYKGFRPHVRGVAQNPVDHPMGGGEGRESGGGHPVSPWGKLAKGKRTRNPKKGSKKFIVERRKK